MSVQSEQTTKKSPRVAPFSLRLTDEERQRLDAQAGSMPKGAYIKSVIFADDAPKYRKRRQAPSAEQQLLAEVLARLGQTKHANNLNQIAKHLNQGTLVLNEDLAADINAALADIVWMRAKLMAALGVQS